jgi:DNA-binding NtrC family response regulator
MVAMLEFHRDGRRQFQVRLSRSETQVGRGERCDVTLPEEHVSRVHFVVRRVAEHHQLVDRSRNGTFLNGDAVTEAPLHYGDRIALPPWEIRFVEGAAGRLPETVVRDLVSPLPVVSTTAAEDTVLVEAGELVVREGPAEGERYVIRKPEVRVGSDPSCDWVLTGDLAPRHFRVHLDGSSYRVERDSPDEELWLDGAPVDGEADLAVGTRLRAGTTEMELQTRTHDDPVRPLGQERFGEMVARSAVMRVLFHRILRVAPHDVPVLVLGETGTGKELVARAIHDHSRRAQGPFVAVNCGALPGELIESELFGHVKGAFTGATSDRAGAFREAHGGTLFLDEVGDLAPASQVRFLRVLESGTIRPVGADREEQVDVRIVAATHKQLADEVHGGGFREDLFFRLAVMTMLLPPLRERREDIPLLARHFLETQMIDRALALSEDAEWQLLEHPWRGNVRALRNVIIRAALLADGDVIEPEHIQFDPMPGEQPDPMLGMRPEEVAGALERAERDAIEHAIADCNGNKTAAARKLGIAKSTLHAKIRKWGVDGRE